MSSNTHRSVTPLPPGRGGGGRGRGRGSGRGRGNRSRSRDSRLFNSTQTATASTSNNNAAASRAAAEEEKEEADPLSIQAQMVVLLDKNSSAKNGDSITKGLATSLYEQVMAAQDAIIDAIRAEASLDVLQVATAAFNARLAPAGKRANKTHYVEKMAKIYMAIKDVRRVKDLVGRQTRHSVDFGTYMATMQKFEKLAKQAVDNNIAGLQQWANSPFPPGERDRKYKAPNNHSLLPESDFPQCPCGHTLIDGPLLNDSLDAEYNEQMRNYLSLYEQVQRWKNGQGPQPSDADGNLLDNYPPKPKAREKMFRCHCDQNLANPRTGEKCAIDCTVNGQKLPLGQCPLCKCTCNAYFPLRKYRPIMRAIELGSQKQAANGGGSNTAHADQEGARRFLQDAYDMRRIQERSSYNHYASQKSAGMLRKDTDVSANVEKESAIAQAMSIAGGQPSAAVVRSLRNQVDSVQHTGGQFMTSFGDIRNFSSSRTAAGDRVRNNGLNGPIAEKDHGVIELEDTPPSDDGVVSGNGAFDYDCTEDELLQFALNESMSSSFAPGTTTSAALMTSAKAVDVDRTAPHPPRPRVSTSPRVAAPSRASVQMLPLEASTPPYIKRSIEHANTMREENREQGGEKKERFRCAKLAKRVKDRNDFLHGLLVQHKDKDTPARHQLLMNALSDEEE